MDIDVESLLAGFTGIVAILGILFGLLFLVASLIAMFKIFEKAGESGIAAIIPFYNLFILCKISFGTGWLMFVIIFAPLIPVVGELVDLLALPFLWFALGKSFGKSTAFCIGMALLSPVFMLLLAFSDSSYTGPGIRLA